MVEIKKILFPTDFSEYAKFAQKYAFALAESFKAKLYVMHASESMHSNVGMEGYFYDPAITANLEKNEKETLNRITEELRSQGIEAEPIFVVGRPYMEIVQKAKELDVDLITLATHGRSGLSHLVFGSVAEKVVRLAPCPVLTIKHPEHEFVT